jgi:hypothetical protein
LKVKAGSKISESKIKDLSFQDINMRNVFILPGVFVLADRIDPAPTNETFFKFFQKLKFTRMKQII